MKARRNYLKILSVLLLSSILLSGCAKTRVITVTHYTARDIPVKELPKPIDLHPVTFEVVSYKNLDAFLEKNAARNGVVVFISLDTIDYENLSLNMAELKRYIEQQKAIIMYYEEQAPEPVIEGK